MKKLAIVILLLGMVFSASSQEITQVNTEYVPIYLGGSFFTNIPKQKTPPKGSVYLNDDFRKGEIFVTDTSYIANVLINYNFYTKRLELKTLDSTYIISPLKIKAFKIKGKDGGLYRGFQYYYDYPEFKDCGLVKVYFDQKGIQLVEKFYLKLVKANYNVAVDAGSTSDTYYIASKKYIIHDGKAYKIGLNKSSILNALKDKKDEIKKFAKDNNLKYNNLSDVLIIMNYYASIK